MDGRYPISKVLIVVQAVMNEDLVCHYVFDIFILLSDNLRTEL